MPSRRARWPASDTRTSYQVGRPWMLEGKMFFGLTGMPMRNSVLAKMPLAEAEPEPLTVANFTTKSLMPLISRNASFQGARNRGLTPVVTLVNASVGWVNPERKPGADPAPIGKDRRALGHR